MGFKIFSLFGEVLLKDEAAQKGLDNIDKKGEGIGKRLGGMAKTAAKWGAGLAAGAAVAVGGMVALVNKTSAAADEIDKMSIRTQLSRTQLQELRFATGQVGVDFGAIEGAVSKMTRTMSDAQMGTARAQEAFEKLGVSTTNADGSMRNADAVFQETLASLSGMSNETERNALAMEVFGRGANELTPLLDAGTDGIAALSQQAHDLGSVLSDEAIAANVKYADTMDAVKTAGAALVANVGNALLPIVQKFLDWVLQYMPQIQETAKIVFEAIQTGISYVVDWITKLIGWLSEWRNNNESNLSAIQEKFMGLFESLRGFIESFITWATEFWEKYGEDILGILQVLWDQVTTTFKTAIDLITEIFNIFSALFSGDWDALWENVKNILKIATEYLWETLKNVIDLILRLFGTDLATVKQKASDIFNSVRDTIIGVFDTVVNKVQSAIQKIKDLIDSVLSAYQRAKDTVNSFVSGAKDKISNVTRGIGSFVKGVIPGLAEGGEVTQSGRVLVGENAPEILELPRGAKVKPLDQVGGTTREVRFEKGAFDGAIITDDYGVDRLMDRVIQRLRDQGVVTT